MSLLNVQFLNERTAETLPPRPDTAMISITNPGAPAALQPGWPYLLRIEFADCTYDERTIELLGRLWPVSSYGFPTKTHAQTILRFLDELPPTCSFLLVHCGAGVSRSAAVAKFVALRHGLPFPEGYDRHNVTLFELLQDPGCFDAALAQHCQIHDDASDAKRSSWLSRHFARVFAWLT